MLKLKQKQKRSWTTNVDIFPVRVFYYLQFYYGIKGNKDKTY